MRAHSAIEAIADSNLSNQFKIIILLLRSVDLLPDYGYTILYH